MSLGGWWAGGWQEQKHFPAKTEPTEDAGKG
jgi:hypothetical protein